MVMKDEQLNVIQWSFCKKCKGIGCPECNKSGTVISTKPLSEIFKETRREYELHQKDIIEKQKNGFTIDQIIASSKYLSSKKREAQDGVSTAF